MFSGRLNVRGFGGWFWLLLSITGQSDSGRSVSDGLIAARIKQNRFATLQTASFAGTINHSICH